MSFPASGRRRYYVVPGVGEKTVAAVPAAQFVVAVAAAQQIVTGVAGDDIVAGASVEDVVALAAIETVATAAAPDHVGTDTAPEQIGAAIAVDGVVAVGAVDLVVAVAAVDGVVAAPAAQDVVAEPSGEVVGVVGAHDDVGVGGAHDGVIPVGVHPGGGPAGATEAACRFALIEGEERVDDGVLGVAQLEVQVGRGALGVAAVAHPADQLARLHVGPDLDAGGDAPALAVVGARGVVVEVDVPGLPPVVVGDEHRAAGGAEPGDGAVGGGIHLDHLVGHEVDGVVNGRAAVPACPEADPLVVGVVVPLTPHREHEWVVHLVPELVEHAVGVGKGVIGQRLLTGGGHREQSE